jgi:hypothetical protein
LRRALRQLAASVDGCPEALFLAHGFRAELVEALVKAAYIAVATTYMRAGGGVIAVPRLRITDEVRRAI